MGLPKFNLNSSNNSGDATEMSLPDCDIPPVSQQQHKKAAPMLTREDDEVFASVKPTTTPTPVVTKKQSSKPKSTPTNKQKTKNKVNETNNVPPSFTGKPKSLTKEDLEKQATLRYVLSQPFKTPIRDNRVKQPLPQYSNYVPLMLGYNCFGKPVYDSDESFNDKGEYEVTNRLSGVRHIGIPPVGFINTQNMEELTGADVPEDDENYIPNPIANDFDLNNLESAADKFLAHLRYK